MTKRQKQLIQLLKTGDYFIQTKPFAIYKRHYELAISHEKFQQGFISKMIQLGLLEINHLPSPLLTSRLTYRPSAKALKETL